MTLIQHTRRPRREDVRADIVRSATEAFLTQGYRRTNLAELAAAAGYSKGAVYSNFGGKPELFGEVMNSRSSELADGALAEFDLLFDAEDPERGAGALVRRLTGSLGSDPGWSVLLEEFRGLAAEDTRIRAIYTEWRIGQRARLAAQIASRRSALGLPALAEVDAAANLLILLINSLQVELRAAPESTPSDVVVATLALALRSVVS